MEACYSIVDLLTACPLDLEFEETREKVFEQIEAMGFDPNDDSEFPVLTEDQFERIIDMWTLGEDPLDYPHECLTELFNS
ncbi:MAG: hypothetical protein MJZ34_13815 [Paludibacteraceae bacterium]|nr:hypothetical protein [Paludibacteraceae bacterium]